MGRDSKNGEQQKTQTVCKAYVVIILSLVQEPQKNQRTALSPLILRLWDPHNMCRKVTELDLVRRGEVRDKEKEKEKERERDRER